MAYEIYKEVKTQREFFATWDKESLAPLNDELKDYIYAKYTVKCKILIRDNHTCQNRVKTKEEFKPCSYCKNKQYSPKLTHHHVKFRKNHGKYDNPDKVRNGVTLCNGSHRAFHRGKISVSFDIDSNLPSHIKGQTFKVDRVESVNWKKVKAEMKKLRTEVKHKLGTSIAQLPIGKRVWYKLTWEQIYALMKFLENPLIDEDDD